MVEEHGSSGNGPGADSTADAYARARRWQIIWPQVIARAWADTNFKDELIKDPKATIETTFNYKISEELHLEIHDLDKPEDWWEELPPKVREKIKLKENSNSDSTDLTNLKEKWKFDRKALMGENRKARTGEKGRDTAKRHPETFDRAEDSWEGLPPMHLTLYIPPRPDAPDQAIAITAYSDTGRTYPMTSG